MLYQQTITYEFNSIKLEKKTQLIDLLLKTKLLHRLPKNSVQINQL